MFQRFLDIFNNRHDYVRDWKARTGGKAVGYFCCYVPEELFYAAGVLPVRVLGSHQPSDVVEPHIFAMYCPFSRDVLAQGLEGRYDYLDGITMAHSCMHMRQAYDSWRLNVPTPFSHYVFMPCKVESPHAKKVLDREMELAKEAIEGWTGKKITDKALGKSIEVYNTNRRLLRQLYELRKSPNPPLSGLEAMQTVLACMVADKAELNPILQEIVNTASRRSDAPEPGVRLMLIGGENDELSMVETVEGVRGQIVVDDYCIGTRYFWEEVKPSSNLLSAIADRYLAKPSCPTKDLHPSWEHRRRKDHILSLIKDWNVQGALITQQKFCDPHELDIPFITHTLKENGIPSLFLELDTTFSAGQVKTRAEAFVEMLELELV